MARGAANRVISWQIQEGQRRHVAFTNAMGQRVWLQLCAVPVTVAGASGASGNSNTFDTGTDTRGAAVLAGLGIILGSIFYAAIFIGFGRMVVYVRKTAYVLASTANLLKVSGWRPGAPFGEGSENFQVMREWNRSEIYRKTMVLMAQRIGGQ